MRYRIWLLCLLVLSAGTLLYVAESRRFERIHVLTSHEQQLQALEALARQQRLPDFKAITDSGTRKRAFFDFLAPLVQTANNVLAFQARKLALIQADLPSAEDEPTVELDSERLDFINSLAQRYLRDAGAPMTTPADTAELHHRLSEIRQRLLPIPASLPLAQAAVESAWGTSRFARKGNNLFGQWCFQQGCGMVPRARSADSTHEVTAYESVYDSVVAYLLNINAHPAYADLRAIRRQTIQDRQTLDGSVLADGLLAYSQRGQIYVDEIRALIANNKLSRYVHTRDRDVSQVRSLTRQLKERSRQSSRSLD